jgi:hypothetical protein
MSPPRQQTAPPSSETSLKWRIYYGNGEVFSNLDGEAHDAPRVDVQVIVQKDASMGWELISESDLYYYEEKRRGFYACNPTGSTLWDHLMRAKYPLVLMGRMITEDEYREIVQRVLKELPTPKTSWRRGEPSWAAGR